MKSKSAEKVRLTSFDDLFGTGEAAAGETVTSVPLSQLHTFKDHPLCDNLCEENPQLFPYRIFQGTD